MKNTKDLMSYFSLFGSVSTLICCALPSLFVMIGMGAAVAGLISYFPQIVWLSEHKNIVFFISGIIVFSNVAILFFQDRGSCPADERLSMACQNSKKWAKVLTYVSLGIWCIGFFFAFLASYFL